jgi:hypothetical protein
MEWPPVYHVKGWGKFNRYYGDFCTGADTRAKTSEKGVPEPTRSVDIYSHGRREFITNRSGLRASLLAADVVIGPREGG